MTHHPNSLRRRGNRAPATTSHASAETLATGRIGPSIGQISTSVVNSAKPGDRQADQGQRPRQQAKNEAGHRHARDKKTQRHDVPRAADQKHQEIQRPNQRGVAADLRAATMSNPLNRSDPGRRPPRARPPKRSSLPGRQPRAGATGHWPSPHRRPAAPTRRTLPRREPEPPMAARGRIAGPRRPVRTAAASRRRAPTPIATPPKSSAMQTEATSASRGP